MIAITKIFEFAAAHHLPYHTGLCRNVHCHNYKLEITVVGEIQKEGIERGMVMDFGHLKTITQKAILKELDHCNLSSLFDNPTAEIMAKEIARQIQCYLYDDIVVTKVRLWKTSTSYVTWKKD